MRKLILLLIITPLFAISQNNPDSVYGGINEAVTNFNYLDIPLKDGSIMYEQVQEAPGITKDQLYAKSKLWFVNFFKDARFVIQGDDKDAGIIAGKGYIQNLSDKTLFTVSIEVKEGKYRARVYSFEREYTLGRTPITALYEDDYKAVDAKAKKSKKPVTGFRVNKLYALDTNAKTTLASIKKELTTNDTF